MLFTIARQIYNKYFICEIKLNLYLRNSHKFLVGNMTLLSLY